jgi:hypothetical protein
MGLDWNIQDEVNETSATGSLAMYSCCWLGWFAREARCSWVEPTWAVRPSIGAGECRNRSSCNTWSLHTCQRTEVVNADDMDVVVYGYGSLCMGGHPVSLRALPHFCSALDLQLSHISCPCPCALEVMHPSLSCGVVYIPAYKVLNMHFAGA